MNQTRDEAKVKAKTKTRDTLLEDHIGRVVVCRLGNKTIRGVLKRVARYEIELEVGDKLIIIFKHALTHTIVLRGRPKPVHQGGRGR